MRSHPPEPMGEQCTARAQLPDFEGKRAFACWYPQMGGYVGKCIVLLDSDAEHCDVCFEAFVWHDGEFPFGADSRPNERPARLHHCMPSQFVAFGAWVLERQND